MHNLLSAYWHRGQLNKERVINEAKESKSQTPPSYCRFMSLQSLETTSTSLILLFHQVNRPVLWCLSERLHESHLNFTFMLKLNTWGVGFRSQINGTTCIFYDVKVQSCALTDLKMPCKFLFFYSRIYQSDNHSQTSCLQHVPLLSDTQAHTQVMRTSSFDETLWVQEKRKAEPVRCFYLLVTIKKKTSGVTKTSARIIGLCA